MRERITAIITTMRTISSNTISIIRIIRWYRRRIITLFSNSSSSFTTITIIPCRQEPEHSNYHTHTNIHLRWWEVEQVHRTVAEYLRRSHHRPASDRVPLTAGRCINNSNRSVCKLT